MLCLFENRVYILILTYLVLILQYFFHFSANFLSVDGANANSYGKEKGISISICGMFFDVVFTDDTAGGALKNSAWQENKQFLEF